ncbi:MAG: response regulator transcription factor [Rhodospirillaceae bacterium]|nr:response regulator transcription factor [Rhodospirillaceae bacterium]
MRAVVADDHGIVRESLKQYLMLLDDDMQIDEAETLDAALVYAGTTPPVDLLLLDLDMPGMNGVTGLRKVQASFPTTRTVIISGFVERGLIGAALRAGAHGYIPKTTSRQAMITALRLVLAGDVYVPPAMVEAAPMNAGNITQGPASEAVKLSAREAEVLTRVVGGDTNKTIAQALGLQDATVKVHIRNIYRKIGARSRTDAINIIVRSGGVDAWTAQALLVNA